MNPQPCGTPGLLVGYAALAQDKDQAFNLPIAITLSCNTTLEFS